MTEPGCAGSGEFAVGSRQFGVCRLPGVSLRSLPPLERVCTVNTLLLGEKGRNMFAHPTCV
jgi:hypothetical protein